MDHEEYNGLLGGVIRNFQSLEFLLRLFLGGNEFFQLPLRRTKEGDTLPECQFTDWDSLGQLMAGANRRFLRLGLTQRIDPSLVKVRDAFAHGRVFAPEDEEYNILFKFGRPRHGKIRIEARYTLDEETLRDFLGRTADAIEMVAAAQKGHDWQPDLSDRLP